MQSMISASGSTNSDIQISEVTQLAKTETVSFSGLNGVSNATTITGEIDKAVDLKGNCRCQQFGGQQMSFEYGNRSFTITFDSDRSIRA